jgi:GH15 family glucan-1,4-alpha-glucosidase
VQLSRSFAGPPNQPFFVVCYTLANTTTGSIAVNVLDQVHLNTTDQAQQIHAWYDATQNAFIADMTASGQLFVVLGALQVVDGYQAANDADTSTTSPTVSGWCSFDANGTLQNNADVTATDVSLAFNKRVTVAAGQTATVYFYIGVCDTQADATAAIATAAGSSGATWFATTAAAYNTWLTSGSQGRRVNFEDTALNQMFDRALIVIKNLQNPVIGTFAATTNPLAYGYKNWVRDASTTSMALDASGHYAEAELYWRWMAGSQGSDGTWKTTYDTWSGSYVPFVEPEYDSIGAFIYGVYKHYTLTADTTFLSDLWPNVKRAADWILANIQPNGFGQADYSIWEEDTELEHNSYTQSWYVAGLYATQALAEALGNTQLTEWYAGGAASILTALQRPSNWYPPGSWNPLAYYNRAVNADNSVQPLIDSSSDMLIALRVIDHESNRAANHIATILGALTKDVYGLARYPGDTFYYTGAWSPGGNEALAPEPSWPQMSLWVAVYDILRGQLVSALPRMQWCAGIYGTGYMPPGEAVSNVTQQPCLSSMSEPLTASAFILTALLYEGQYTLSLIPPLYNAGTYKALSVSFATSGDWPQWQNVPYFVGPQTTSAASSQCTIKRVYLTNDYTNLYLRIDNVAGTLPLFQQEPAFALHVYCQDLAGGNPPSSNLGIYNQPLSRPMSFMVERRSTTNTFQRYSVANGNWIADQTIPWVIEPQWDPATGRLEAVIPISVFASASPSFGNAWVDLSVILVSHDATTDTWSDADRMLLHYRLSTPDQAWTYGNIEQ